MRVTLFRLGKPKKFSYKPRHYDPVLEDLHSRVEMIKSELEEQDHTENTNLTRTRIRNAWRTPETRKSVNNASTMRIALIAAILFGLFYVYFFTEIIS